MTYPGSNPDGKTLESIDTTLAELLKETQRVAEAVERLVKMQQDRNKREGLSSSG